MNLLLTRKKNVSLQWNNLYPRLVFRTAQHKNSWYEKCHPTFAFISIYFSPPSEGSNVRYLVMLFHIGASNALLNHVPDTKHMENWRLHQSWYNSMRVLDGLFYSVLWLFWTISTIFISFIYSVFSKCNLFERILPSTMPIDWTFADSLVLLNCR